MYLSYMYVCYRQVTHVGGKVSNSLTALKGSLYLNPSREHTHCDCEGFINKSRHRSPSPPPKPADTNTRPRHAAPSQTSPMPTTRKESTPTPDLDNAAIHVVTSSILGLRALSFEVDLLLSRQRSISYSIKNELKMYQGK